MAYHNMWLESIYASTVDAMPSSLDEEVFAEVSYNGADYEQMQEVSADAVDWCADHDMTVEL